MVKQRLDESRLNASAAGHEQSSITIDNDLYYPWQDNPCTMWRCLHLCVLTKTALGETQRGKCLCPDQYNDNGRGGKCVCNEEAVAGVSYS